MIELRRNNEDRRNLKTFKIKPKIRVWCQKYQIFVLSCGLDPCEHYTKCNEAFHDQGSL
jgi:hypothetical protein